MITSRHMILACKNLQLCGGVGFVLKSVRIMCWKKEAAIGACLEVSV